MKNVISLFAITLSFCLSSFAQKTQDNLKKEKRLLEKKIEQTKSLLKTVQKDSKNSLHEVEILENQIRNREALLRVYDGQLRMAELKILSKNNDLVRLNNRIVKLRAQYKLMLRYAYKKRNNLGRLMFLLSARSYQEALHRHSYLKKMARLQQRQFDLIAQNQNLVHDEISQIELQKSEKANAINEKKEEQSKIEADRSKKEQSYTELKENEEKLLDQLAEAERKRKLIESRIQSAILEEARKAEKKKKEKSNTKPKNDTPKANNKGSNSGNTSKRVESENLSSEGAITSRKFENNRGLLPTPVVGGSITSKFGKNAHSSFKNVYENNNGIDVSCAAGSNVRAVFEGEVSSVFSIAGAGKVVIIKHGNYRSVYSNMASVSVNVGQLVGAKQKLGSLLSEGNISVLHFEIHSVYGINITPLNPSVWLSH